MTPNRRAIISLIIFVHFFFVFLAMISNIAPRSELQRRLLTRFAFYTQLFNIDLDFTPYHLTHATERDVDHRIEVLPAGGEASDPASWHVLPDAGSRAGPRYKRYQRLGRVMAVLAEDEASVGRIAASVATHFLNQRGIEPRRVRCRSHMLQSWQTLQSGTSAERDPYSAGYFREPYLADCIVLEGGRVRVSKLASESEVAQPGEPGAQP